MKKLFAKIIDRESNHTEKVVLVKFTSEEDEDVFVEEIEHHGDTCFKVLLDEGYLYREYYYPCNRYTISHLEIYED